MLARNNKDETTTGTQEVHLLNTEKGKRKKDPQYLQETGYKGCV